jgi:integrase
MRGKLTNSKIQKLNEPCRLGDGNCLWLQVSRWGTKSWIVRYWRGGRERNYGLGPYPLISLTDARKKALTIRRQLFDGRDPVAERKAARVAARLEAARTISFGKVARDYIEAHRPSWKSDRHAKQWLALEWQAKAIWTLPVGSIGTEEVLSVLKPMWRDRTITATRIRARIEMVLGYAAGRGLRPAADNPARWRGHLESMLAKPNKISAVKHHRAIAVAEIPAFATKLRARDDIAARALELVMLTAVRSSELADAKWSELDFAAKVWTIPGERMKRGREHRVPLSDRAVTLFKSIHPVKGADLVFEGIKSGDNTGSLLAVMREIAGHGQTVHGLRSSFRDWCGERTNYPRDLIEEALAHAVGDKTERAYKRSDLLEKRRKVMDAWARYCASTPAVGGNVVEMVRA